MIDLFVFINYLGVTNSIEIVLFFIILLIYLFVSDLTK